MSINQSFTWINAYYSRAYSGYATKFNSGTTRYNVSLSTRGRTVVTRCWFTVHTKGPSWNQWLSISGLLFKDFPIIIEGNGPTHTDNQGNKMYKTGKNVHYSEQWDY